MPICGFNDKMLKGLTAFNEGLVEHGLIHHSKKNGETLEQGIKREISDMTRLLLEVPKIEDSAKRVLTEGLVRYAMGFYFIMRRENIDDYKQVIGKINDYFKSMDSTYYGELEGKPNDMERLIEHLDKIKV